MSLALKQIYEIMQEWKVGKINDTEAVARIFRALNEAIADGRKRKD